MKLVTFENPCQSCGACCTAPAHDRNGVNLIGWVTATEGRRLPAESVVMAEPGFGLPPAPALAATETRCVNLAGVVGVRCTCSVYDNRPKICRDFEAGSDRCNKARARIGKPPVTPLELLAVKLDTGKGPPK